MFIMRLHELDEFEDMRISTSIEKLKKDVEERLEEIYKNISYVPMEECYLIMADTEEIGVIGAIEEI
jgi:hypothetical protein